ncbi:MAG: hypothetical protein J6C46_00965 [Clostridia bacterium]|nr:hypothetical protein [Clostridia bacterium]
MKNKRWYKLDNAAKIFPPTTDQYDTKTFRFSVSLKEEIEEKYLLEALTETLKDYPIFHSTLKKGFFWYYLEESDSKPRVQKEERIPCDNMYGLLYRVTYYKRRINLEVSHALTDATGTMEFLKSLTANYLKFKYKLQEIPVMDTASTVEKSDDSFEKYYKKARIHKKKIEKKSYKIKGLDYPENRIKIIEGIMSTSKVLELSKKYNTTMTVFLTSLLIDSIGQQMTMREKKRPVYITVPVNLRKYFPSKTIRNFFNTISVSYKFNDEYTFEDIIESVDKQFKTKLTKEALTDGMSDLVLLENIFVLRVVPRFIKDFVLRLSFEISRKMHTMTLSNIGVINMPEMFDEYIDYFDVFSSTDGIQACLCSFKEKLVISFTSHFINSEIEKNFFRTISDAGISIDINTNVFDEEEEK